MKTIKVDLEDKDYAIAKKRKGKRTWKDVVMSEPLRVAVPIPSVNKKGGIQ